MNLKAMIKVVMLFAMVFGVSTGAMAALITGNMGITGSYSTYGGTDMSDDTDIILGSATGTSGSGDLGGTVVFGTPGVVGDGDFSIASFVTVTDVFSIGGWQLDLTGLSITDQTSSLLTMVGTGILSGNGFESTLASWTYSSQLSASYSMTVTSLVTPVPVPAAVWLFGSGLLGLIGLVRRKAS